MLCVCTIKYILMLLKEELTVAFLSILPPARPVHYTCTVISETYYFLVWRRVFSKVSKKQMWVKIVRGLGEHCVHSFKTDNWREKNVKNKVSGKWRAVPGWGVFFFFWQKSWRNVGMIWIVLTHTETPISERRQNSPYQRVVCTKWQLNTQAHVHTHTHIHILT